MKISRLNFDIVKQDNKSKTSENNGKRFNLLLPLLALVYTCGPRLDIQNAKNECPVIVYQKGEEKVVDLSEKNMVAFKIPGFYETNLNNDAQLKLGMSNEDFSTKKEHITAFVYDNESGLPPVKTEIKVGQALVIETSRGNVKLVLCTLDFDAGFALIKSYESKLSLKPVTQTTE